jgi:RES domain-containing protein
VASQEDLDIIFYIEGLTNPRLRNELGEISLVPENERIFGSGTTPIMSAFTHLNPEGSRFTDGSYGVYYAAKTIDTAIAETKFHKIRFLAATHEPAIEVDMRSYASNINADCYDVRGMQTEQPDIYNASPSQYSAAQTLAKNIRKKGSNGIVYDSVRHKNGECIAIFRPNILSPVKQGKHYCYVWDGQTITSVYEKSEHTQLN